MNDTRDRRKDVATSKLGSSFSLVWSFLCDLGRYYRWLLEWARNAADKYTKAADRDVPPATEPNPKWDTVIDRLTKLNALIIAALEDPDPNPIKYAVAHYDRHPNPNAQPDSYTITVTHTEPTDARHFATERRPASRR